MTSDTAEPVVAYRPAFARIQGADGKPLGTEAALFLSQAAWLSERAEDADGWFEWSQSVCEEQTGLTRRQQETARQRLGAAGLLERERRGKDGRLHFRVWLCPECTKTPNRNGGKRQTEEPFREGIGGNVQTGMAENAKPNEAECTKTPNRNGGKRQTEELSSPPTPYLSEPEERVTYPPTPQDKALGGRPPASGEAAKAPKPRKTFAPPTSEEVHGYIVGELRLSIADAEQFFDHWQSRDWRFKDGQKMADWKATARNWKRRAVTWENERKARASPAPQSARDMGLQDKRAELEGWFAEE